MPYKKIFISGGAGVIGSCLISHLLKEKVEIFVGDLKPCPKEWEGKIKYRQGDLNTITVDELNDFKPDLFFHLAATFERSEETAPFFEENFHHNILLSHHLLACLKQVKSMKRIVFASSYLIYDPKLYLSDQLPETITSLCESCMIAPRNICGGAKLFFEEELKFMGNFDVITHVSARIFRVYGKNSRDIISRWIRSALNHEELIVYRPEGKFDYIYADDVATGLITLANSDYSGVINLGTGHCRSVGDVITILKNKFPDLQIKKAPSDIPFESSSANMEKFRRVTRWSPKTTIESGIEQLIEYYRNLSS